MSTKKGTSLATPIYGPQDRGAVDVFGENLEQSYRVAWSAWRSTLPDFGDPHPDNANAYFMRAEVSRDRTAGDIADVVLYYEELPATRTIERASEMHVDVRLHPSYASLTQAQRENVEAKLRDATAGGTLTGAALELYEKLLSGQTTYIVGMFEVEQTHYTITPPTGVGALVGTLLTPAGYGASTLWLCVGGALNQEGSYWARTFVHRYSARGWDADLY